MPLDKLPKVLVTILDNMLSESIVSSWYVRGGSEFTQVSIKFEGAAMTDSTLQKVAYKKLSQKRMARDMNRAQDWRANMNAECQTEDCNSLHTGASIQHHIAEENIISEPNHNEYAGIPADQYESIGSIGAPPSLRAQDIGGTSIAVDNTTGSDTMGIVDKHGCTAGDTGNVCIDSISEDLNRELCGEGKDNVLQDFSYTTDNLNNGDVQCNVCDGSCNANGNKWYRCTVCNDFDVCNKCYRKKEHAHHHKYIHPFTYPDNCNHGYCDSCGFEFRPNCPTFQVFQCLSCEDYALCKKCHNEKMHVKHLFNMRLIPARDYLQYIQGVG